MDNMKLPHHHGEGNEIAFLQEQLNNVDNFQIVADVFKQLGDATRIRIYWLLCHCEECVINISALLDMSSPAVSHHLRSLKNSGLIVCRRIGKEVYYHASDTEQGRLLHQMIEQVMEITCPKWKVNAGGNMTDYQSEQVKIIRSIHEQLVENLDQRYTIDSLSKQYLMNATTLKKVFKAVYGTSIAAHIKMHRMEQAAKLLRETQDDIIQIAQSVGYESQSKFTAAFKEHFKMLPTEYRKK